MSWLVFYFCGFEAPLNSQIEAVPQQLACPENGNLACKGVCNHVWQDLLFLLITIMLRIVPKPWHYTASPKTTHASTRKLSRRRLQSLHFQKMLHRGSKRVGKNNKHNRVHHVEASGRACQNVFCFSRCGGAGHLGEGSKGMTNKFEGAHQSNLGHASQMTCRSI